jgi:uncharacterized membrane protein (DUF485 family)
MTRPTPGPKDVASESQRRGPGPHPKIDWRAAEESPEFKELIAKRRGFVLPATVFFFVAYFGFVLLAGYAPGFMGGSIYRGLTVGYALMLALFFMVWALVFLYLRRADNVFDPLSRRVAARAIEVGNGSVDPTTAAYASERPEHGARPKPGIDASPGTVRPSEGSS